MKKLIAVMGLACMFAVGCKTENKGGTSDSNYSTSGTTTSDTDKMQDKATRQSETTIPSTNSTSSGTQP